MPALLDKRQWTKMNDEHYKASGEDAWWLKGSHFPSPTGSGGAIRIMKPKPHLKKMWEEEIANCKTCQAGGMMPRHGTTSFFPDGSMYTYQCRSFSRAINPVTGEINGSTHCTCDGCF